MRFLLVFLAALLVVVPVVRADGDEAADASTLYDLSIQATPKLKKGAEGSLSVRITPKTGAEIHKEAPIKLELTAPDIVALSKSSLGRSDMKMDDGAATFEVPFTGKESGKGTIETTLSFYICTEKMCSPQKRTASLPVAVR